MRYGVGEGEESEGEKNLEELHFLWWWLWIADRNVLVVRRDLELSS